ncbi:MAG: O-methyltransferase [Mollicutes bacterium]|nr:O-methyltransferase [Mollicutes bacterium]
MDRISKLIKEIEEYGIKNNVPIMSEDTIETIKNIITVNEFHTILEVGTAIGYSTICFASTPGVTNITSIERDPIRSAIAVNNVKKSELKNITLRHTDALEIELNDKFDLIIIDAAKSQNMKFFNKFKDNLNEDGIIIIDNLSFHGYVNQTERIKSRNLRQMVNKIRKFIDFLNNNEEFTVKYIEVGDTLGVCKRKNI